MNPIQFRRHLHMHPELSFREHDTAAFISARLSELGIEHRPIAGTGVLSVVYIAMAFGAGREILTSIAPKSVTVPIAVSVSGPLGGIVPITSVVVFCVGIFGSIFGEWILRRCGVRDAEARGFALGAAAHGIGTARAIEIGAVEGALSGLAMALMGLATALLMPLMERYLY